MCVRGRGEKENTTSSATCPVGGAPRRERFENRAAARAKRIATPGRTYRLFDMCDVCARISTAALLSYRAFQLLEFYYVHRTENRPLLPQLLYKFAITNSGQCRVKIGIGKSLLLISNYEDIKRQTRNCRSENSGVLSIRNMFQVEE